MKGMLEDVQLLANEYNMKTVTKAQLEQIAKAMRSPTADDAAFDSLSGVPGSQYKEERPLSDEH